MKTTYNDRILNDMHVASILAQHSMKSRKDIFNTVVLNNKEKFTQKGWKRIRQLVKNN
jgi:hypothetical protein